MTTYISEIKELFEACGVKPVKRKNPCRVKAQVKPLTDADRHEVDMNSSPERIGWRPLRAERVSAV